MDNPNNGLPRVSEREKIQNRLVEFLENHSDYFSAPYGVIACAWQRFTLKSLINGNQVILQMDSGGHVTELRPVQRTITVLETVG